jgi:hypothetical protein
MTLRKRLMILAGIVLSIGAILVAIYVLRAIFGAPIGERCESHLGCTSGGVCISHRCQKRCNNDQDCPSGWGCRGTSVVVTRQRTLGHDDEAQSTEKICFPPESLQPRGTAPGVR